jgi:hypothetical protein
MIIKDNFDIDLIMHMGVRIKMTAERGLEEGPVIGPKEKKKRKQRRWTVSAIASAKIAILDYLDRGFNLTGTIQKLNINANLVGKWRDEDPILDKAICKYTQKTWKPDGIAQQEAYDSEISLPKKTRFTPAETKAAKKEFLNGLKIGMPIDYALMLASANRTRLTEWMRADGNFLVEVNQAQAQNLGWWIQKIRNGAEKDWRAALAYLERVFPSLFAETKQVEITQKFDKGDEIQEEKIDKARELKDRIKNMSDDQLIKLAEGKHVDFPETE